MRQRRQSYYHSEHDFKPIGRITGYITNTRHLDNNLMNQDLQNVLTKAYQYLVRVVGSKY
jgi:hypothetical protein